MNIERISESGKLTLKLEGRIDTKSAPELDETVRTSLDGVTSLIIDLKEVAYISSAGLRVLLIAQKQMNKQGEMKIINVSEDIMEIFEVTGFSDILHLV